MTVPSVFVAVPQYRIMPIEKEMELAKEFGFSQWRPLGFHPKFTQSIGRFKTTIYGPHGLLNVVRGDSMIERARASLLGAWLEQWNRGNRYEYFMQIDEDIEFPADAIPKLIESGKPLVGASYAYRARQGPKVGRPVSKRFRDELPDENGLLRIRWLGGGFVLCHYSVLFTMMEKYQDLHYDSVKEFGRDEIRESYMLWSPLLYVEEESQKKIFLSEDYAFAERARLVGFDSYEDTTIDLVHWDGTTPFMIGDEEKELNQDGIPGWMNAIELNWLGNTAKAMESIVEIGSWKGRSTKVLLENCPGTVYAVDHFKGSPKVTEKLAMSHGEDGTYPEFIKNVGHFKNLVVMRMPSLEAAEKFNGHSFDMVFIDGDHRFNSVVADLNAWIPRCRKIICGHDYPEVVYAVRQVLGDVNVVGTVWYKEL